MTQATLESPREDAEGRHPADRSRRRRGRRRLAVGGAAIAAAAIACGWPAGRSHMRAVVEMSTDRPGLGQIYYARDGAPFQESLSVRFNTVAHARRAYVMDLPVTRPEGLALRLDPTDQPGATVTVFHARFEFFRGPRVVVHEVPPETWLSGAGIAVLERGPKAVVWKALNRDPQLPLEVPRLPRYTFWRLTVALAALLFGAACVVVFDPPGELNAETAARWMLYVLALGTLGLQAFVYARRLPFNVPPDEWPHISAVLELNETGRWVPDRLNRFEYDEWGERTSKRVRLSHPAFYYHLCRPFVPAEPRQAVRHVRELRHLNILLALAGVGVWFWLAARRPLPLTFHLYAAAALTSVPMLPYLAGAVNNDNLVLLAGGLTVWGALRWLEEPPRRGAMLLMAAGWALALLTKFTSGLHAGLFVALVAGERWRRDRSLRAFRGGSAAIACALLTVPCALYVGFWMHYGSPAPTLPGEDVIRPAAYPRIGTFARYFVWKLSLGWTGIFSHSHVLKRNLAEAAPFLAVPLLAGVGALRQARPEEVADPALRSAWLPALRRVLVATVLFGLIHLVRSYLDHLETGYGGGIQARYYFTLMPGIVLLSYRPFLGREHRWPWFLALATLSLGLLASGFYYYAVMNP